MPCACHIFFAKSYVSLVFTEVWIWDWVENSMRLVSLWWVRCCILLFDTTFYTALIFFPKTYNRQTISIISSIIINSNIICQKQRTYKPCVCICLIWYFGSKYWYITIQTSLKSKYVSINKHLCVQSIYILHSTIKIFYSNINIFISVNVIWAFTIKPAEVLIEITVKIGFV